MASTTHASFRLALSLSAGRRREPQRRVRQNQTDHLRKKAASSLNSSTGVFRILSKPISTCVLLLYKFCPPPSQISQQFSPGEEGREKERRSFSGDLPHFFCLHRLDLRSSLLVFLSVSLFTLKPQPEVSRFPAFGQGPSPLIAHQRSSRIFTNTPEEGLTVVIALSLTKTIQSARHTRSLRDLTARLPPHITSSTGSCTCLSSQDCHVTRHLPFKPKTYLASSTTYHL